MGKSHISPSLETKDKSCLVSIVLPAKNAQSTIAATLESILCQELSGLEILVIDDGSTDGTIQVVRNVNDERIRVLAGGGCGVSHARNVGIAASRGRYIMFVDADDELVDGCLSDAIHLAEITSADVVYGGLQKVWTSAVKNYCISSDAAVSYVDGDINSVIEATIGYESTEDPRLNTCHLSGCYCKLIRSNLLRDLKFDEDLKIGEDSVFNVALLKRCKKILISPNMWYRYHQNQGSTLLRYRPNSFNEGKCMVKALRREAGPRYSSCVERRAFLQLEGAARQRISYGCPERSLFDKASALRAGLKDPFWANYVRGDMPTGLSLRHRITFTLFRTNAMLLLCFVVGLENLLQTHRYRIEG